MGRPIDPTSRNQIDRRAKRLRDPESRWTEILLETLAQGCLRAQRWSLHLEDQADPGPMVGSFPKLPDEPGERVRIGYKQVPMRPGPPGVFLTWDVSGDEHAEMPLGPDSVDLVDEVVRRLETIHVRNHLRPSFYREVAAWMGEQLEASRNGGRVGSPGPFHDIWTVPLYLVCPPDPPETNYFHSQERLLERAAAWHFARVLYRKLLNARPDAVGRCGLERPALLRQLMEELEVLEPSGLKTQPVGEKAVTRMTTHEVPMLGFRAFPRADKWDETEDGRGRFLHNPPSTANGHRRWELTIQEGREDLAFASLARCQQLLERGGLEITALHGLLCCHVMQQEDPGARFEVAGDDLLKDLGLSRGGTEGSTRSDLLKRVASCATLLGGVRCEGNARNRSTGTRISMEFGPMWSIAIRADGQLTLLDGVGGEQMGTVTDLTLTVTPGTWVTTQRTVGGGHLLYVPLASRVLSLGRYRQELAFRLGIHLSMGLRERKQWQGGRANVRVGQLLADVLPSAVLEKAHRDRKEAHKLRQRWEAALVTLQQVVGFRFDFPPDEYPAALIPEDLRPAELGDPGPVSSGALEQLEAARLEIHWPEAVMEAIVQKSLPQQEQRDAQKARREQRTALQSRPNGARLKEALEAAKAAGKITGRRQAAERLGLSLKKLSFLENGHQALPERELQRCLALLETFRKKS